MREPYLPKKDARIYQILSLFFFLLSGVFWFSFEISLTQILITFISVISFQLIFVKMFNASVNPLSGIVTGFSLCLLFRTNHPELVILCAFLSISSKFLIRWRNKHIFNPANFGIVAMLLFTDRAWVSPGQWGNFLFFGFLFFCLGLFVVLKAFRTDTAISFLFFYTSMIFLRSYSLGDPVSIPIHKLQSGALLLFSFFMISDPKTTPDSFWGRILFSFLVALLAYYIQFIRFRNNGLILSLAILSLTVPLIDWLLPGKKYEWHETK
ncbi:MAG: RnfABCDGE type electron transport complex subunit D [Leptospira sp.]|nr:RnfABCDGE type electron transport complex subunit D [Leptospira sp.]